MLTSSIVFAVASALALFILLVKVGIRRVLGYDVAVDIACTVILLWSFAGTVTGMAAAMIAAVGISLLLLVAKLALGYQRLEWHQGRLVWVTYLPRWPEWVAEQVSRVKSKL